MAKNLDVAVMGTDERVEYGEVFGLISRVARNLEHIQRMTIKESGLTPSQFFLLQTLHKQGDIPLKDLAEACNCTRATITGMVDVLEREGLVKRLPNPHDRRSLLAGLTPEGERRLSQSPSLDRTYQTCCAGLAPHEYGVLNTLLLRLDEALVNSLAVGEQKAEEHNGVPPLQMEDRS